MAFAMLAGQWPQAALAAPCGAATAGGSGPPSISASEVSTAQALQILRRRQDEQLASAQGGLNVASLSQTPPPAAQPAPAPAPVIQAPAPKPAAATPPPAPKIVTPPAPKPVVAAPVAKPAAPAPVAKPQIAEATPVKPAPAAPATAPPAPQPQIAPPPAAAPATPPPVAAAPAPATAPADTAQATPKMAPTDKDMGAAPAAKPADAASPGMAPTDKDFGATADAAKAPRMAPTDKDFSAVDAKAPSKAPRMAATDKDFADEPKAPAKTPIKAKVKKPAAAKVKAPAEKTYVAAAPAPTMYRGMKDDPVAERPQASRGVWAQGYYDYERQGGYTLDGGAKGALTAKTQTVGMLAGADLIRHQHAREGDVLVVGVLGGYSSSRTRYNDTTFKAEAFDGAGNSLGIDTFTRENARDTLEGGSVGLYSLYTDGNWSVDGLLKFDFMDLNKSDIITACNTDAAFPRSASADVFNVVVAANFARRYMHTASSWFEPVVGFRYTHTDYSNIKEFSAKPPPLAFGLDDGDIFRLQGGLRYGVAHVLPGERVWITTLGGFLYSDVAISGISKDFRDVNEGKLRAMGQLTTSLTGADGTTYFTQLEVRGGDDMIGFGAKAGLRHEW